MIRRIVAPPPWRGRGPVQRERAAVFDDDQAVVQFCQSAQTATGAAAQTRARAKCRRMGATVHQHARAGKEDGFHARAKRQ
jgi:hypothetical protein